MFVSNSSINRIDLHVNGVPGLMERLKTSGAELAVLETEVAEAEAVRDRAKLSNPDADVADIGKIYDDLAHLSPEDRIAARAKMRERLGRLVEKVVIGPSGCVSHHQDGGQSTADWIAKRRR